jgi:LEA14-like dessication related protein
MTDPMKKSLIFLLSLLMITGCINVEPPKVTFIDSNIEKVTAQGIDTVFRFNVSNPNIFAVDVSRYNYTVKINGHELLSEERSGFSVSGISSREVVIPVTIKYEKLFDSALGVIANLVSGKKYFDYAIDGTVSSGAFGIAVPVPIKASGRIDIPMDSFRIL